MPATSKAQFRFMQGVAHGSIHASGLTSAKAAEYVKGQSPKSLPEKASKPKMGKVKGRKAKPLPARKK